MLVLEIMLALKMYIALGMRHGNAQICNHISNEAQKLHKCDLSCAASCVCIPALNSFQKQKQKEWWLKTDLFDMAVGFESYVFMFDLAVWSLINLLYYAHNILMTNNSNWIVGMLKYSLMTVCPVCLDLCFRCSIWGCNSNISIPNLLCLFFFCTRYTAMLEDMKKNPESNGGPPDCVVSLLLLYLHSWIFQFTIRMWFSKESVQVSCFEDDFSFFAGSVNRYLENWDLEIFSRRLR